MRSLELSRFWMLKLSKIPCLRLVPDVWVWPQTALKHAWEQVRVWKILARTTKFCKCRLPEEASPFFSVMCPCTILSTLKRQISQITWLFWGFHRSQKVSQGLPGVCAPDQLRNELSWKKQGQTPSSFYLSKVAKSSCQLTENSHWIGRGFQDHFDPMLSSILYQESTKSITSVLPQLRSGHHR